MSVSRRTLSSALRGRHFADGAPTWLIGRGKQWGRPCDSFVVADRQRQQLIVKLQWLSKHHNLHAAQQLARKLRRCGGPNRCMSGACPVCVRALQRLFVEVGIELDRSERQLP
jgi:hypothetical protein